MDRRKGTGIMIFSLSIAGFFVYAYLLMLSEWSPIIQQLSMLMIVGGILGVIAWIGYVTATTRATSATITSYDDAGDVSGNGGDGDGSGSGDKSKDGKSGSGNTP